MSMHVGSANFERQAEHKQECQIKHSTYHPDHSKGYICMCDARRFNKMGGTDTYARYAGRDNCGSNY
jgi:hypothetical protein